MSLIRLITTIIRLSFAKGLEVRRDPARPTNKKATRAAEREKESRGRERRARERGKKSRVYALIQPISRFSAENPTLARS